MERSWNFHWRSNAAETLGLDVLFICDNMGAICTQDNI